MAKHVFHTHARHGAEQASEHEARLLKMYGCDVEAFLASARGSITYTTGGPAFVAISMLSDVQELIAMGRTEEARQMINRAKRLLSDDVMDPFVAAQRRGS
jgi:hypothetical protein